jgi:hypothetical protein
MFSQAPSFPIKKIIGKIEQKLLQNCKISGPCRGVGVKAI